MQKVYLSPSLQVLGRILVLVTAAAAHFLPVSNTGAASQSGIYQTDPAATVKEGGDQVSSSLRIVPWSVALTLDLDSNPSLTAVIQNAVLEGGAPFGLVVHSSLGTQLPDGTFRFTGDYLQELTPPVAGYGFDWTFSPAADGGLRWDGVIGWSGGHLWQVTISDLALEPVPEPGSVALVASGLGLMLAFSGSRKRRTRPVGEAGGRKPCR